MSNLEERDAIARVYDACAHRVYGYALRRCVRADAEDVVAEVFARAWRRRADLPEEPLPWLLATARNVISEGRRSYARRERLLTQAAAHVDLNDAAADETVLQRHLMLSALDSLTEREREALLLVAWDGLSNEQAALVIRCSPRAFRARLTRARARLAAALTTDVPAPESSLSTHPEGIPT